MNRFIKLCMSVITLVACSVLTAEEPAAFTKQIGESLRYSIVLPSDWQTSDMGAQVLAWPGATTKSTEPLDLGKVPVKVLITAVELTGSPLNDLNLDKLFEASLAEVKKNVGELQMVGTGTEQINGHKSKWGLMTYKLPGAIKSIQQLSYMFKEDKTAYVVECLIDQDQYSKHADVCKRIITSFKILAPIQSPLAPPTEMKPLPKVKQQPV